jgi:hypothetical protein
MEAIEIVDIVILEGHRDQEAQDRAVAEGKSQKLWPTGNHNSLPSKAVDAVPYLPEVKIDWKDVVAMGRMMGIIQAIAHRKGIKLRFGLDWDGDFRTVDRDPDESFLDAPHVELA